MQGGRWKESPRRGSASALQEAVVAARLREAQAQAELRALRQRVLQLETQVRDSTGGNWGELGGLGETGVTGDDLGAPGG